MGEGDVPVLLDLPHCGGVGLVGGPGLHGLQLPAAAVDLPAAGGSQDIAAVRAYVKFQSSHISNLCFLGAQVAHQQASQSHAKNGGERRQQADVRAAFAPLPFADGLWADVQRLRHLQLSHSPFLPQPPQQLSDLFAVHVLTSLSAYPKIRPLTSNAPLSRFPPIFLYKVYA